MAQFKFPTRQQPFNIMIKVYCYLTDEQAHYLSLSNEDRKKVPNRKAILESLCLLPDKDDEDDTETKEAPKK